MAKKNISTNQTEVSLIKNKSKTNLSKDQITFNTLSKKIEIFKEFDLDCVYVIEFTKEKASLHPLDFIESYLKDIDTKIEVTKSKVDEKQKLINTLKKKSSDSVDQYKTEERSIIAKRILSSESRTKKIIECMSQDKISTDENILLLSKQVYKLTRDKNFINSKNMGEIIRASFNYVLRNYENHEMLSVN